MVSSGESAFNPLLDLRIAVLVPCRNEAASISKVVHDFRLALPGAAVFVYDNNSDDETAELAREAGAIVRSELLAGKGNVVRRMFADIEADIYVLVDGDDTYDASSAEMLIERLESECLDMVNAVRVASGATAYRPGHRFGNALLTGIVALIFGNRFTDLLSGYRIFSRRFVKSFPALASGFEIETELTVHALELRMPIAEIETPYRSRPSGSVSNLRTLRDGWRILRTILLLSKEEKPLPFFSLFFAILVASAVILFWPVFITFLETGLVPRFPTAILSTGLMLLAFLSLGCGIVLDTVTRGRQEMKRMHYLSIPRHRRGADD
jgi:glycosyltransferase involved in cell wall biosynthesis